MWSCVGIVGQTVEKRERDREGVNTSVYCAKDTGRSEKKMRKEKKKCHEHYGGDFSIVRGAAGIVEYACNQCTKIFKLEQVMQSDHLTVHECLCCIPQLCQPL